MDAIVTDHGSIVLVLPITAAALVWIDDNVDPEATYFGHSLAVEARYFPALLDGMREAGLDVRQG